MRPRAYVERQSNGENFGHQMPIKVSDPHLQGAAMFATDEINKELVKTHVYRMVLMNISKPTYQVNYCINIILKSKP